MTIILRNSHPVLLEFSGDLKYLALPPSYSNICFGYVLEMFYICASCKKTCYLIKIQVYNTTEAYFQPGRPLFPQVFDYYPTITLLDSIYSYSNIIYF